jgi:ABC-type multidrug transport system fused ATPase/permease subunit
VPDPRLGELSGLAVYKRVVGLLDAERALAAGLVAAGIILAIIHLAEPILFGRVVDALSKGQEAFSIISLWALLGLFGIAASTAVAIASDRLAHRRRIAALTVSFEQAITLPISYHAEKGSGAVVRAILAGTDSLFWLWLSFLREQLSAMSVSFFSYRQPSALTIEWRPSWLCLPYSIWQPIFWWFAGRTQDKPPSNAITATFTVASAMFSAMSRLYKATSAWALNYRP